MKNRILYRCLETNRYLCTIIQNKMGINKLKVVFTKAEEIRKEYFNNKKK